MAMSLVGAPTLSLMFLVQTNFYFDMFMYFLYYLLSDGYLSPAMSMM